jgi:hypothetical protein
MNAPLPFALLQALAHAPAPASSEPARALGPAAAQQWVWHSRFGTMKIEVVGQTVYVNGDAVQPARGAE